MSFRRDVAADTLLNVMAELQKSWAALGPELQAALRKIIDDGGHDLYQQSPINRPTECVRMLDKVAALTDLPATVKKALDAGAGISTALIVNVSDQRRDQVLAALCRVHDPRRYSDPWSLAEELHKRISEAKRQLDPATRQRWEQLDAAVGDPGKYLDELDRLLGDKFPFVRQALAAGKTWEPVHLTAALKPPIHKDPSPATAGGADKVIGSPLETLPGEDVPGSDVPSADGASPAPAASPTFAAPPRVQRSANVYFPATVQLTQKRVPLIVHLARAAATTGTVSITQGSSSVTLTVGDLIMSVLAPDFDVDLAIGGSEVLPGLPYLRRVEVKPSDDSEPVIFFLSPIEGCEIGKKRISVQFMQNNQRQGALAFDVAVVEEPVSAASLGNAVETGLLIATRGASAPDVADRPDLDLRVVLQGNLLSYSLVSADGRYQEKKLGQKTLVQSDPRAYFASITDRLSQLASQPFGAGAGGDEAQQQKDQQRNVDALQALGVRLWNELIPPELAQVYDTDLRPNYAGKSLVITSDEPYIPWEMVRPIKRQDGQALYIDPPLCEQFRLTRWLDGKAPPDQLRVQRGVIVAPEDNLQFVKDEIDYFAALKWTVPIHTLDQVNQEFDQGNAQLFHFSCHGKAGAGGSDEAALKLGDDFLAPSDVLGRDVKLYKCTPLVFLNACEAGQPGFTLTGLGGWAQAFIQLQASIFIGSLWAINDELAADFAKSFYNRLWGLNGQQQQSVGEAFHAARQDIKQMAPGNPTWLAYVLYGDPNGRVYINA